MRKDNFYERRRFSRKKSSNKSKKANSFDSYKKDYSFGEVLSDLGNQKVQNFVEAGLIQAKLNISQQSDFYEKEADRIAEGIVRGGSGKTPGISKVQLKSDSNSVNNKTEAKIHSLKGRGNPLGKSVREYFEPRFGVDLGNVRIHTDNNANQLAKSINAKAFTYGNDIAFNKGEYQPNTQAGKKLIAHELTHTLQQGEGLHRDVVQKDDSWSQGEDTYIYTNDYLAQTIPQELTEIFHLYRESQQETGVSYLWADKTFIEYLEFFNSAYPQYVNEHINISDRDRGALERNARIFILEVQALHNDLFDAFTRSLGSVQNHLSLLNDSVKSILINRLVSEILEAIGLVPHPATMIASELLKVAWDVFTIHSTNSSENSVTLQFALLLQSLNDSAIAINDNIREYTRKITSNDLLLLLFGNQRLVYSDNISVEQISREFEIEVWKNTLNLKWNHLYTYILEAYPFATYSAAEAEINRIAPNNPEVMYEIVEWEVVKIFGGREIRYKIIEHWLGTGSNPIDERKPGKEITDRLFNPIDANGLGIPKSEVFNNWGLEKVSFTLHPGTVVDYDNFSHIIPR